MARKGKKTGKYSEELEVEKSYRKVAGKYARQPEPKKRGNGLVIAICILVLVLLIGGLGFVFMTQGVLDDGLIMKNVTVAGVDVGGMTKEEAIQALNAGAVQNFASQSMVITILEEQLELTPQDSQVQLDVKEAVNRAYDLGRTGSAVEIKEAQLLASTVGITVDISDCLSVNNDGILAKLNTLQLAASGELVQSTWELTGDAPTLDAEEDPGEPQTLVITVGQPAYTYDQAALLAQIPMAYAEGCFAFEFDCTVTDPDALDLDALYAQCCTEMADASMDPETFEVSPHSYGHAFDLEAVKEAVSNAQYGEQLEFPLTITEPEVKASQLSAVLFRDVLSTYTSYQASSDDRATNMRLACEAINGTVLLPGDEFDFNKIVGERTPEKGYRPAATYEGGKTVQTYGGGICQPSSTIYYCALLADMEIVERECHSYPSYYVPFGMDATIYWPNLTFRFRNNTQYPLRIDAVADGGNVTVTLVGTDTKDYYVKMENEILAVYSYKTIEVPMEANNPKGYKDGDVITTPYTGYKVRTYRCRYSKADDTLIERVFEADSIYSKRDEEIARIITPETTEPPTEAPTMPPATEPPATEPPTTPPADTTPTTPPATDPPATDPPAADSGGET